MKAVMVLCALTGSALADAKSDITALVKRNATAMADADKTAYNATLSGDGPTYEADPSPMFDLPYLIWGDHVATMQRGLSHQLKRLSITVEAASDAAWFYGAIDAQYLVDDKPGEQHHEARVVGVATRKNNRWKLAAIDYAPTIPDKELWSYAYPPHYEPPASRATDAAKVVAAWFADGAWAITGRAGATSIARGTAPGEVGVGAAADKLTKAWDALHIQMRDAHARAWGNLAYVEGDIRLPAKAGGNVELTIHVVLVKDGDGGWKWAVIDFAPHLYKHTI
jgi:ketosteroid isomerase-like protein